MLGLYPDCPGEPYYTITTPVFDKVSITTPQSNINIECNRPAEDCHYIDKITVNGEEGEYRITHATLLDNANIELTLKREPR